MDRDIINLLVESSVDKALKFPLQKLSLTSVLAFAVASGVSSSVTYVTNRFVFRETHKESATNAIAAGVANGLAAGLGNFSIGSAGFLYDTHSLHKLQIKFKSKSFQ